MSEAPKIPRVLEKYYSLEELSLQVGFSRKFWADKCKAGELTLVDGADQVIAQPVEIGKKIHVPASCVNAFLARHPYRYDPGVKARNVGELRRRLAGSPRRAGVFCG